LAKRASCDLTWFYGNVVPYYISTIKQNQTPTGAQIKQAIPYTQAFVDELKSLKVVVYCGLDAQKQRKYLRFPAGVHQLETFHLAGQSYNHKHKEIQATFKQAYDLVMH
jgi:hypothetical protein